MAKERERFVVGTNQLSLFDLLKEEQANRISEASEGSLNVHSRLRVVLSLALKSALPKSRWEIAGELSHLLGIEISKYQIDSWVCESKEGHRIRSGTNRGLILTSWPVVFSRRCKRHLNWH